MTLETMEPDPIWDADSYAETVETFEARRDELTFKVWGGDWCGDCRAVLPAFAAALEAAGIPDDRIEQFPVDRDKRGEGTQEYGVEYIPTIVVERDGREVARFVEEEPVPAAVSLAEQIRESDPEAEGTEAEA